MNVVIIVIVEDKDLLISFDITKIRPIMIGNQISKLSIGKSNI